MMYLSRMTIVLFVLTIALSNVAAPANAGRPQPAESIFVDTDIGVDDAVAIAWLMEQPRAQIVGFSTVFGNTSSEHAARNLLTLFGAAGRQYPVALGASQPLTLPATRIGAFVHGPDGLWFNQAPADISGLPNNAPAAIAAAANAYPGLTIVALGPLTNIARAVQQYPSAMSGVRLVALGGARRGGNITPVSEFNSFADPQALQAVLASDMQVELLTLDAFSQLTVNVTSFPARLTARGGPVGKLLANALNAYFLAQQTGGPLEQAAIPDAAAMIYALNPQYAQPEGALVDVIAANDVTRGQTVIGLSLAERLPMSADEAELSALADQAFTPGFDLNAALAAILQRRPDNAMVILDLEERPMQKLLERSLAH